jgi:hypothetical protein
LDPLPRQRERAGDHRLRRNDGRCGRQQHQREQAPTRHHAEERVLDCRFVAEDQGALPEIIEDESGKHHGEPCQPDREAAKMAHIGIKRLASGDGERDGPEHHKPGRRVATKMRTACTGFNAQSTCGVSAIYNIPLAAITVNHNTSPGRRGGRRVRCHSSSGKKEQHCDCQGRTDWFSAGVAMPMPSTALNTG